MRRLLLDQAIRRLSEAARLVIQALQQAEYDSAVEAFGKAFESVSLPLSSLVWRTRPENSVPRTDWTEQAARRPGLIKDLGRVLEDLEEEDCVALEVLLAVMRLRCKRKATFPKALDRRSRDYLIRMIVTFNKMVGALDYNTEALDQVYALALLLSTFRGVLRLRHGGKN